jgi:hypothetical protein
MRYEIKTGKLFTDDGLVGVGWAGHSEGKNNPDMQNVRETGPLPVGIYTVGDPINSPRLGPLAFPLTPDPSNKMYGRSGFYLHAPSISHPAMSSDGCIIMVRAVREHLEEKIKGTPQDALVRKLEVVVGGD